MAASAEGQTGEFGEQEGQPSKIDAKQWFRDNGITGDHLDEMVDRYGIEIEEFFGLENSELQAIALGDLKLDSTLMQRRFVRKIRELEKKKHGGVRKVVLRANDPDRFQKMREFSKKHEKVDVVLLSQKESEIMENLEKKKIDLNELVKGWSDLDGMREQRQDKNIAEMKKMSDEIDRVIKALKKRKTVLDQEIKKVINEERVIVEGGLDKSRVLATQVDSAIKSINDLAITGGISDEKREKETETISKEVIDACKESESKLKQSLNDLKSAWPAKLFEFRMDTDEWISKVNECGQICRGIVPIKVSVEDGVLGWKLPSEENDYKSDDPIEFQVVADGKPLGEIIKNEMKMDLKRLELKQDHRYSIQVKARMNAKVAWGSLSNSIQFKTRTIYSAILHDEGLAQWLLDQIKSKLKRSVSTRLIYRASRDGWTTKKGHEMIDRKGAGFFLMKSEFGNVYGGFTSIPWSNKGDWKSDENAFIFLLKGNESILKKYNVTTPRAFYLGGAQRQYAVYHNPDYLVWFGNCGQVGAQSNSHQQNAACTKFPYSYQLDPSKPSTAADKCDLISGHPTTNTATNFKMKEIEFFLIL